VIIGKASEDSKSQHPTVTDRARGYCLVLTAGLMLLAAPQAAAAPGDLDETFSGDGVVQGAEPGDPRESINPTVAVPSDGSVVVAGVRSVARYTAAGKLDRSFAGDGTTAVELARIVDLVVQPDGAVLLIGLTQLGGIGENEFGFIRLRPDGTPDPTFDGDGGVSLDIEGRSVLPSDLELDAAGRIIGMGSGHGISVVRLLSDGSPDPSFSEDGRAILDGRYTGGKLAARPDGSLVVASSVEIEPPGSYARDLVLFGLQANGEPDPGFGESGVVTADIGLADGAESLIFDPQGRIVVGVRIGHGLTLGPSAGTTSLVIACFSASGEPLGTFLGGSQHGPSSLAVGDDGRLLVAGARTDYAYAVPDFSVGRFEEDGTFDQSFGQRGAAVAYFGFDEGTAYDLAVAPDGRIVAAGTIGNWEAQRNQARHRAL
jgi:uncharacterized delta-60 repeat protein